MKANTEHTLSCTWHLLVCGKSRFNSFCLTNVTILSTFRMQETLDHFFSLARWIPIFVSEINHCHWVGHWLNLEFDDILTMTSLIGRWGRGLQRRDRRGGEWSYERGQGHSTNATRMCVLPSYTTSIASCKRGGIEVGFYSPPCLRPETRLVILRATCGQTNWELWSTRELRGGTPGPALCAPAPWRSGGDTVPTARSMRL